MKKSKFISYLFFLFMKNTSKERLFILDIETSNSKLFDLNNTTSLALIFFIYLAFYLCVRQYPKFLFCRLLHWAFDL